MDAAAPRPLARVWGLVGKRRRSLERAILLTAVAQGAGIPLALLTRILIREAGAPGGALPVSWLALLGGIVVVQAVAFYAQRIASESFAQGVIADLRKALVAQLLRLPLGSLERRATGKTLVRFVGDAGGLRAWLGRSLVRLPADVLTAVGVAVALALLAPWMAAVVLLPLLLLPLALWLGARAIRARTRAARSAQSSVAGDIGAFLAKAAALKAQNAEEEAARSLAPRIETIAAESVWRSRAESLALAAARTGLSVGTAGLAVVGAWRLGADPSATGDLLAGLWLALLLRGPCLRFATATTLLQRAHVSAERIAHLLGRERERGHEDELAPYDAALQRIRWKRLGFRDAQGRWILRRLRGVLEGPGLARLEGSARAARIWIELLLRLRRPHEGRIALDGVHARKLRVEAVREKIAWFDAERAVVDAALVKVAETALGRAWERCAVLAPTAELSAVLAEHRAGGLRPREPAAERLALACALAREPRLLVLEDPALAGALEERWLRWIESASAELRILLFSEHPALRALPAAVIEVGVRPRPRKPLP